MVPRTPAELRADLIEPSSPVTSQAAPNSRDAFSCSNLVAFLADKFDIVADVPVLVLNENHRRQAAQRAFMAA
jgi:hypothetical protein